MYHVWMEVDEVEVLFKCNAMSRGSAVRQARSAYPDGSVVSVLPA